MHKFVDEDTDEWRTAIHRVLKPDLVFEFDGEEIHIYRLSNYLKLTWPKRKEGRLWETLPILDQHLYKFEWMTEELFSYLNAWLSEVASGRDTG